MRIPLTKTEKKRKFAEPYTVLNVSISAAKIRVPNLQFIRKVAQKETKDHH